jgi:hypothetical protein
MDAPQNTGTDYLPVSGPLSSPAIVGDAALGLYIVQHIGG